MRGPNRGVGPEHYAAKIGLFAIQELGQRYDTALELLGERNERVDQLEEDIAEMKQIFHGQISMMADQLKKANRTDSHAVAAQT